MKGFFWCWVAIGCSQNAVQDDGTVVGNPGDGALRLAEVSDGEVIAARTRISAVEMEHCSGRMEVVDTDANFDLMEGNALELPHGQWCGLQVVMEEPLYLEAVSDDGTILLEMTLAVESVALFSEDGFEVEQNNFNIELGYPGWISMDPEILVDELELDIEEWEDRLFVDVDTDDGDIHDDFSALFADASGMYADPNSDGMIDAEERATGWVAGGVDHPAQPDEDEADTPTTGGAVGTQDLGSEAPLQTGAGCGAQESRLEWMFIGPLMIMGFRRYPPQH